MQERCLEVVSAQLGNLQFTTMQIWIWNTQQQLMKVSCFGLVEVLDRILESLLQSNLSFFKVRKQLMLTFKAVWLFSHYLLVDFCTRILKWYKFLWFSYPLTRQSYYRHQALTNRYLFYWQEFLSHKAGTLNQMIHFTNRIHFQNPFN